MEKLLKEMAEQKEKSQAIIRELREKCFSENVPFLITSEALPDGEAYYEYANGRMEIRKMHSEGSLKTELVRVLTDDEAGEIKKAYGI